MTRRVVVTGLAYATGLGFGHEDHEPALRAGRSAAGPITRFDTTGFRTARAAQVDEAALDARLGKRHRRLAPDTKMLLWAVREALADSRLEVRAPLPAIVGTTTEGFLQAEQWYAGWLRNAKRARPALLLHATAGAQMSRIAAELGLPLAPEVVTNACATGLSAIGRLFRRIRSGAAEAGIAGGYDALTRFVHLGFDSLGALSPGACTPFAKGRTGFFIGDGAAILVLESLESARRRGARIRAEISGYGESADGHHQTHPQPEGTGLARAIARALESAGVAPGEIGYVNAHGTATPANDAAEAKGLLAALGPHGAKVPVSSTKPLVGHTLGAAGAVEQAFCLLAMEKGFLPPQAGLAEPDPACGLNFVRSPEGRPRVTMNESLGFGGANGVVIARAWEEGP